MIDETQLMKKRTTSITAAAFALTGVLVLNSCSAGSFSGASGSLSVEDLGVIHEDEFGGVYLTMTIEEFNASGFGFGDSVNIEFSNGYELRDIPYYNGYYAKQGDALVVGYPGYPYIEACMNSGDDLYLAAGLTENDHAAVTLAEKGKYLVTQNARDIHYEDDRSLYESDAVFANFRAVTAGNISEGKLYRSASPCDNKHCRAPYADALMGAAGVNCIIDLADTEEKLSAYIGREDFDSPNFLALYEKGNVVPLAMSMSYTSDSFKEKIVKGFSAMTESEGAYLIHCTEGKDRTGFVCMLLEALCGATYQEIKDDYMLTFYNYYGIDKESDPVRYDLIAEQLLEPMLRSVIGDDTAPDTADLAACAERYLTAAGMSSSKIAALRECLK